MKNPHDLEVINNLRMHVSQVEEDLYKPKPRYMDAFFFPEKKNVYKIERYIKMAKKELLICVFNLTNNILSDAIKDSLDNGV